MAITSYSDFVDQIAAVQISGVTRQYAEPPHQVSTADLPISYLTMPTGDERTVLALSAHGGWPTLRVDLVVLIEPMLQDVNSVNFAAAVDMMDNISTAFRNAVHISKARLVWSIVLERPQIGNTVYWALVTNIEGRG